MQASQSRLLIVDDDAEMRDALGCLFSAEGHACEVVADAKSALELVRQQTFDAVLTDVLMEGMDGLELLDEIKATHPALPVIMITAIGGVHQAVDAIKRGAFGYAVKPCNVDELRRTVAGALDARPHPGESLRLPAAGVSNDADVVLVGTGPAMRRLQTAIDFVAQSGAPVLVTGETGVGKELVARAIHARGPRAGRPFVVASTSAIPRELLTGADGGTLLIDEVGDMSMDLQAQLLRVLQWSEARPAGNDSVRRVDIRVIATTCCDMPVLVKEGRLRQDLYFRLDVLSVPVPPLRERREDIPALAAHLLARACERAPASPVRTIGRDALRALTERAWPGNVRELASTIERAVVFGVLETIDLDQMSPSPLADRVSGWPFPSKSPWTLERLSRVYADWVLAQTGGDKQRAAAILGIDLSTLYRWQRKRPN